MAGWGLVGSATASAPLDTLEEIIAAQAMKDEAMRKQAIEQRKLGQEDARIGIDGQRAGYEGQRVGLDREKFVDTQTTADRKRNDYMKLRDRAVAEQPWLVPVLDAKFFGDVSVDAKDANVSPEQQRTQGLEDDTAKSEREAAEQAARDQQQNSLNMQRDAANNAAQSARDAANDARDGAKPPKAVNIPSSVRAKRIGMNTIDKMAESVDKTGDANQWKGVGGFKEGTIRGLWKKETGKGGDLEEGLRNDIGNLRGTIANLRSGAALAPTEIEILDKYTPTVDDHPSAIKTKLRGLRQWIKFQNDAIREEYGDIKDDDPNNGVPKMTADELLKKYGG